MTINEGGSGILQSFSTRVDEASSTVTYVGQAAAGSAESSAVWRIAKVTFSGTVTSVLYADSDISFNNIWDDRLSLSYG